VLEGEFDNETVCSSDAYSPSQRTCHGSSFSLLPSPAEPAPGIRLLGYIICRQICTYGLARPVTWSRMATVHAWLCSVLVFTHACLPALTGTCIWYIAAGVARVKWLFAAPTRRLGILPVDHKTVRAFPYRITSEPVEDITRIRHGPSSYASEVEYIVAVCTVPHGIFLGGAIDNGLRTNRACVAIPVSLWMLGGKLGEDQITRLQTFRS